MTKEEAIEWLKSLNYCDGEETQEVAQAIDMAIKALDQPTMDKAMIHTLAKENDELKEEMGRLRQALEQQKPMEKFENAKDHIRKLAGDYKCYDNRLTDEEALELCHILEQQPSDDVMAIHTQGLDEGIRCAMCTNSMKSDTGCDGGCRVDEDMYKKVMDTIRNQIVPPVTPTQRWTPVSERLPKERGFYIVTEKVFSLDDREHKGRYNTMVEQVEYCDGKWQRANFFEVIAWQPLPKPYEEKRGSENEVN